MGQAGTSRDEQGWTGAADAPALRSHLRDKRAQRGVDLGEILLHSDAIVAVRVEAADIYEVSAALSVQVLGHIDELGHLFELPADFIVGEPVELEVERRTQLHSAFDT